MGSFFIDPEECSTIQIFQLFVAYAYAYNIGTIAISACFSAPIAEATSAQESA